MKIKEPQVPRFKVICKARCVDNGGIAGLYLTLSKIYEVMGLTPDQFLLKSDDLGRTFGYYSDRFDIIDENPRGAK